MTLHTIGKYEIIEEIGRGGFATVYQARDTALGRVVALKVLHPGYGGQPEITQRFLNEARQVAQLQHPNIVPIFDVGEGQGRLYLAMAYLPGGSLLQRLTGTPLPVEMALTIVEQVAAALTYAHKKHLVHRDVKPANILFDEENRAMLVDFGLVKSLVESGLTVDGTRLGTPAYMAPEQSGEGGAVGPATDTYALGVVTYEMLTGCVPFAADTPLGVLNAHAHTPPPDPRSLNPNLDDGLVEAVLRALDKDPAARYTSSVALAQALKKAWTTGQRISQTQTALEELYAQAQTALQAGKWGQVINLCVEMRNLDPDFRDVGTLLTLAASRLAEEEEQRQQQRELAEQFTVACQLLEQEDYPAAIAALEALAVQAPDFPNVAENLAKARIGQQKAALYTGAQTKLADAAYADACTDLLALLEQDADYEGAVDCLRTATAGILEHLTDVQSELKTARAELTRSRNDTEALRIRVTALEAQLEEATAAHKRLEKASRDIERQLAVAHKCIGDLEVQVQQSQVLAAAAQTKSPKSDGDVWVHPNDGKAMVRIPAGEFLYGEGKEKRTLPEFWIDKTPVTNAEYAQFVQATGHTPPQHWKGRTPPKEIIDHPVTYMSWQDAVTYAKWAGKRLPTEEEWEKAARGTDGRVYPWGNQKPTRELCNFSGNERGTTPVGRYSPQGDSPYGCVDMSGNVWEWTGSDWSDTNRNKVMRGGSWDFNVDSVRSAYRYWISSSNPNLTVGLRCVVLRP